MVIGHVLLQTKGGELSSGGISIGGCMTMTMTVGFNGEEFGEFTADFFGVPRAFLLSGVGVEGLIVLAVHFVCRRR